MIDSWYSVRCNDCLAVCGGTDDMRDTAKQARRRARELGWVHRNDPDTGRRVDICAHCAAEPRYHEQSTMNVQTQLDLFDQRIDATLWAQQSYWRYLKTLFIDALAAGRPQPFSYFEPMFAEEFS